MRQIVVISGKGGTGKTVLSGALAGLARRKVMADCDVDAANLHLLLKPRLLSREKFFSGRIARIDRRICKKCGRCREVCRFKAISESYRVDEIACEGCDYCLRVCPHRAVKMEERQAGECFLSDTPYGLLVHARLFAGQPHSGKLVTRIRKTAEAIARRDELDYIIIDGPPGIGCPLMAALSGTDCALVVGEPTLSGLSDAARVMEVAGHFKIPFKLVVNKWDLNPEMTEALEGLCREKGGEVAGRLPFDRLVVETMVRGRILPQTARGAMREELEKIWHSLSRAGGN